MGTEDDILQTYQTIEGNIEVKLATIWKDGTSEVGRVSRTLSQIKDLSFLDKPP